MADLEMGLKSLEEEIRGGSKGENEGGSKKKRVARRERERERRERQKG